MLLVPESVTTRSSLPSPLKSPEAIPNGEEPVPKPKFVAAPNDTA